MNRGASRGDTVLSGEIRCRADGDEWLQESRRFFASRRLVDPKHVETMVRIPRYNEPIDSGL